MSNPIFDAAFSAEIATLERIKDPKLGNVGYGSDLSCVLDLTPDALELDDQSRSAIGQATLRRLITARGTLPDDPDYGLDVRGMLNRGFPMQKLRDLSGQIRSEITKDDRIADAVVNVTFPEPGSMSVAVTITPEDPSLATFDLTVALTADTAELLI